MRQPTAKDFDKFFGFEFDWFAVDETGAIGLFSTAGYGEIPVEVMWQEDAHRNIADQIPLPNIGSTQVWQDFARAGLYVFEWQHWDGPYRKAAAPRAAIAIPMQQAILQIAELPQFNLSFEQVANIKIERFLSNS